MNETDVPTDVPAQDRFTYLEQQILKPRAGFGLQFCGGAWLMLNIVLPSLVHLRAPQNWRDFAAQSTTHAWISGVLYIVFIFAPASALFYYGQHLSRKQFTPLLDELTNLDDPRVVGLLLTLQETAAHLTSENPEELPPQIRQALTRMLPQLQSADAIYLPDAAQTALYCLLNEKDEKFILAVLMALSQVGTADALLCVERLTRKGVKPSVAAAARECYTVLAERFGKVNKTDIWLRASAAPASADTLLRPAVSAVPASEAAAEELLRTHSQ